MNRYRGRKCTESCVHVHMASRVDLPFYLGKGSPVVNLIKLFTIVIYSSRVVLTRKLPILKL